MKTKIILLLTIITGFGCGGTKPEAGLELHEESSKEESVEHPLAVIDKAEDQRALKPGVIALVDRTEVEIRERLATAIGRIGDAKGSATLAKWLFDPAPQVQDAAVFASQLLGDNASNALKQAVIKQLDKEKRTSGIVALVGALGCLGLKEVIPRLAELIEDNRTEVRTKALQAFGDLGRRGVIVPGEVKDSIAKNLNHDKEAVRLMSLFALYQLSPELEDRDKFGDLFGKVALNDASLEVRIYAFEGLAKKGDLDEVTIEKAIKDPDNRVAAAAVSAIRLTAKKKHCFLAARALDVAITRMEADPTVIQTAFAHTISRALELAADCPNSNGTKGRARQLETTVTTMAEPRTEGAAKILCLARLLSGSDALALLSCDPKRPVNGKRMIIKSFSRGSDISTQDLRTLTEMVSDPDPRVSMAALHALGNIPEQSAQDAVLTALSNRQTLVVVAALNTIAAFPDRFVNTGDKQSSRSSGAMVINAIARVVDRFLPFPHAHTPLITSMAAIEALRLRDAEPILLRLATDPRPSIRYAALKAYDAIDGITPPKGLPVLAPEKPVSHQTTSKWRNAKADAIVRTTIGTFSMTLRSDIAPATVSSFVALSETGYFDNTDFYHVMPNRFVRAGDPTGTGLGDPGYALRSEISAEPFERGTVGLSLLGKDTGGAKFFITLSRQPELDGLYPVFGRVTSGFRTLDRLQEGDRILGIGVRIEK